LDFRAGDFFLFTLGGGKGRITAEDQAASDIGAPSFHTTLQGP
jgi:hypothetical protein